MDGRKEGTDVRVPSKRNVCEATFQSKERVVQPKQPRRHPDTQEIVLHRLLFEVWECIVGVETQQSMRPFLSIFVYSPDSTGEDLELGPIERITLYWSKKIFILRVNS